MNTLSPIITSKNLNIGYDRLTILKNINFSIYPGDMICLMGHNGCGKTTLLRTLSRFQKKLGGEIIVKDVEIDMWNSLDYAKISSVVLTEQVEGTGLCVYDVVKLGRYPHTNFLGQLKSDDKTKIDYAIEALDISHVLDKKIDELSDGQRQKVFIARALAQDTDILLLDEPTAFLDLPGKMEILRILKKISREKKVAILFSSHDWQLILELVSWIWLIHPNGTLKAGVPEDFIISGDFEKCFYHDQFTFSDELGFFKENRRSEYIIALTGKEDKNKIWTRHLLRKESYKVLDFKDDRYPLIEISCNQDGDSYWKISSGQKILQVDTLENLLVILKTEFLTENH